MFYERQTTMSIHYRRRRKKHSVETTVIWFSMLILVIFSAWLPYFFAQLGWFGASIAIP
jgi:predicted nucleic acid-binding Zn ribbon protein